jgi:hypothetical protein
MASPAARLPRSRPATPEWSRVLDTFYADSFDARSREGLVEAMEAFGELPAEDQAFHQAHLAYRNAQALGDVHAALLRIEGLLRGVAPADLAMLRHLPGIRKALVVLAKGQEEMLEFMDAGSAGVRGEEDAEEEPDEDEGDEAFAEEDDDEEAPSRVPARVRRADPGEVDVTDDEPPSVTIVPPEDVQVIVSDAVLPAGTRGRRAKADT